RRVTPTAASYQLTTAEPTPPCSQSAEAGEATARLDASIAVASAVAAVSRRTVDMILLLE
ncbi:hypothetical protein, partial [Micromonospora sp. DT227]|uniref:hypothetical protein n=1 Tax=Micromonospora sp. DT227 TaxID=3393433 RepID=UPI003CEA3684